ncbi:WG repeat-containing protein [Paenibacillus zanthoxyli]|uniref:WG repeat-containing protein n=1 Tax=Paenibacillus zanthoxyli TaxID=369399 RepID=UPI0004724317|nr:WG repeat-containing protein [Paenibacillus zanthoxyli]
MLKIDLSGTREAKKNAWRTAEVWKWDGSGWNERISQPVQDARTSEIAYAVVPSEPGWYRIDLYSGEGDEFQDEAELRAISLHPAPFRLKEGVLWGYIGDNGRTVIEPRFDYAEEFQENGLAVIQTEGHSGLINTAGKEVVKPVYVFIGSFEEGRAVASDSRGYFLIDEKGKPLTGRRYDYLNSLQEGRALFSKQTEGKYKYGYLDRDAREAIPAGYEDASDFKDGKALVKVQAGEFALIGKKGEVLHTYHYPFVGNPGDGLLAYQAEENGKYGYIDEEGKPVIKPQFTSALSFSEGRAVVNIAENYKNAYGLIDKNGTFVIQPSYEYIQQLGENRVALGTPLKPAEPFRGSSYTIADAVTGQILGTHPLRGVNNYSEGLASVYDEHETYFIDRSGNRAAQPPVVPGSGTLSFSGRLIRADVDQRTSYYDRNGKQVWKENTLIPLRPPYGVEERKFKPDINYLVYYPYVLGFSDPRVSARVNDRLKELSLVNEVIPEDQRDYSYTGDFSVSFFRKNLLQLELEGYRFPYGAAHGMPTRIFTPIDLRSGKFYELKDLFKPAINYTDRLSEIVARQIEQDPQYSYVFPGAFKGIAQGQPFYVDGEALYLYFAPYEIAPYAAGFPTFRIPFAEIMGLINTEGVFWRSFH